MRLLPSPSRSAPLARPALLLALALAGCGRAGDADNVSVNLTNSGVPENVAVAPPPAPKPAEPQARPDKGTAPPSTPASHAIPVPFQGRWGLVPGDCGPDASIAKGLMVVDGGSLRFYESVAKPVTVATPTPTQMEGRFAFSGEGQQWNRDMSLRLEGAGDQLVRTERDPTATYRYKRCPA